MFSPLFKTFCIGLFVICGTVYACNTLACDDERKYLLGGLKVSHQNKKSNLCHSGGISNNAEWGPYFGFGWKAKSLVQSLTYGKMMCVTDGDIKDNYRSEFIIDEVKGVVYDIHIEVDI